MNFELWKLKRPNRICWVRARVKGMFARVVCRNRAVTVGRERWASDIFWIEWSGKWVNVGSMESRENVYCVFGLEVQVCAMSDVWGRTETGRRHHNELSGSYWTGGLRFMLHHHWRTPNARNLRPIDDCLCANMARRLDGFLWIDLVLMPKRIGRQNTRKKPSNTWHLWIDLGKLGNPDKIWNFMPNLEFWFVLEAYCALMTQCGFQLGRKFLFI